VARPAFFADPADPRLRAEGDAFLLGADLLVVPDLDRDRRREPSLPDGGWAEVTYFNRLPNGSRDPNLPQLFQRSGSIVPLGPRIQYVDEAPLDTLTLLVHPDADGEALGLLYEDAGDGYGYTRGEYRVTEIRARREGGGFRVETHRIEGDWPAIERPVRTIAVPAR
jgi:alpha-glucosidase